MDKCIGNYFIKFENREILLEEFINKVIFYLWIDVFKDEDELIFLLIGNNILYENFFLINFKGVENVIKLLLENILNVDIDIFENVKEEKEEVKE